MLRAISNEGYVCNSQKLHFTLRNILLLATLIILSTDSFSKELRFEKVIIWRSDSILGSNNGVFDDAYINPDFDGLPCLFFQQILDNPYEIEDYSMAAASFEDFKSVDPRLGAHCSRDFIVRAKVSQGRNQYFLSLMILPFRKAESYQRLMEIKISVRLKLSSNTSAKGNRDWRDASVLSEGNWYKLGIAKDGVYKIDKAILNALGINTSGLNPSAINIYGNGGMLLPELNSDYRADDLEKCAIYFEGEEDGVFDNSDYILFYGKGPDQWSLQDVSGLNRKCWMHEKHFYSDSAYYFIRTDDVDPLRIAQQAQSASAHNYVSTTYQDRQFLENETYNLVQSGREFYGEKFDVTLARDFGFATPNLTSNLPVTVQAAFVIRSVGGPSSFTLNAGGTTVTTNAITSGTGTLASVASKVSALASFTSSQSNLPVSVVFNRSSASQDAQGYLDYLNINSTNNLAFGSSQLQFRDTGSAAVGNVSLFRLQTATNVKMIWDITDFKHPLNVDFSLNQDLAEWNLETNELREFIAFPNFGYLLPTPLGRVFNQNLHGSGHVDLVIVTAPAHIQAAEMLAGIHSNAGDSVLLCTQSQVFNEFSSGNPDVTALRMLMKMLYDRAQGTEENLPDNLLLFGDGNYLANRGNKSFNSTNVILFESDESLGPVTSYVSDDYFVMLSDNDDQSPTGYLDAGVGRIPANSQAIGLEYVEKVKSYLALNNNPSGAVSCLGEATENSFGPWRNVLSFMSDDQDGSAGPNEQIHLEDANTLGDRIYNEHPEYDVSKIYMDAYVQESTPGGERYPEGERAIREQISNGALIITYLGHGGERGWAHERILDVNTIDNFSNRHRLPVFLTATCELARFDNPEYYSAGERLSMNAKGGAIALLTTTRVVFAGSNMQMDMAFFDVALSNDSIRDLSLGKINMLTKNGVPVSNSSKPNFSLLGDPALKMSYPKYRIITSAINNNDVNGSSVDTLKAMQEIEVRGFVADDNGVKLTNYNGFVYPVVYDKISTITTLNNDFDGNSGEPQTYKVYNKVIFRGQSTAKNGEFTFNFSVPIDINYNLAKGRISYYGISGSNDCHGYFDDFLIGGSLAGSLLNRTGPEIEIYFNDTTFVNGGISNSSPVLIARLKDENGINTVANSIGHDIIAVMDDDTQNPIVLNNYYLADLDTYKSGQVRYQLENLSPGNHTLKLRAWDVHNNSSTASIDFLVQEEAEVALDHVLNYPNPFTTSTQFMFEHNQVCQNLDILIQIYSVSGKLVKTIEETAYQTGFRIDPIQWDGRDDFGDRIGKGVYVYKVKVRNENGNADEQYQKLVILK